MVEIIFSVLINFGGIAFILLLWSVIGSVKKNSSETHRTPLPRSGDRSAHSNMSLATIGITGFFLFPILLVGVRWTEYAEKIDLSGYLHVFGFLLTGVVSYLYFVRALKGGAR